MAESVKNKKTQVKKKTVEKNCTKSKRKSAASSTKKTQNKKSKCKKSTVKVSKFRTKMPEDKRFVLSDGKVISSVKELALEIENVGDDVFYYHANEHKNDFSNWLKDVVDLEELAEVLKETNNKSDFQLKLLKYVVKHS